MDSMDNFRERFEALEQQTHTLARQARWWRGIACGVIVLALLGIPLQSGKAQYEGKDLAQRVEALEYKLEYVSGGPNEVVITGANLRIVNGLGDTATANGVGNLIVGYNELRGAGAPNDRSGSHNVIVGRFNNFSSFGGLVVGEINEISGQFASVSGGGGNIASGFRASVSGGLSNTASNDSASVSGGAQNTASGFIATISGGAFNTASENGATISGGAFNTASGNRASVSGGEFNTASGAWSSVSGGEKNVASGDFSSVSGGTNRNAPGTEDWAAGPLFADN
jgi:hypothetical protein